MIRLTELKLPLDHAESALPDLAAQTLGVAAAELQNVHIHKRSFDARKADLLKVYIVDVTLADADQESALLAKFSGNPHILPTPDMAYRTMGKAPAGLPLRPVVVGF